MAVFLSTISQLTGFVEKPTLQARDLRGSVFVAVVDDFDRWRTEHRALWGKICGIVVTVGTEPDCCLVAENLWHRVVTKADLPKLARLVEPWVIALEGQRNEQKASQRLTLDLERARADRGRLEESLHQAERQVHVVLENTGDALVLSDLEGKLEPTASSLALQWFGPPKGRRLWDYLFSADDPLRETLILGLEQLREGFLPEELLLAQLPQRFNRGNNTYSISTRPIADGGILTQLLHVVTDVTEVLKREAAERQAREDQAIILAIVQDRESFGRSLSECQALVRELSHFTDIIKLKRSLHTLKGNTAVLGFIDVAQLCHELENDLARNPDQGIDDANFETLKSAWARIERRVERLVPDLDEQRVELQAEEYQAFLRRLMQSSAEQDIVHRAHVFRLTPVEKLLRTMARSIERLARNAGKHLRIEIDAQAIRLDTCVFGPFLASLIHVVRNAIDHGIETAADRAAMNKPTYGLLTLGARIVDDRLHFTVSDDGRGIDWKRVEDRGQKAGLPVATHEDLERIIFLDGISTKDTVSELSGRGIGLSAVKAAVLSQRGTISVASEAGRGTKFTFVFPVTGSTGTPHAGSTLSVPPPPSSIVTASYVPTRP